MKFVIIALFVFSANSYADVDACEGVVGVTDNEIFDVAKEFTGSCENERFKNGLSGNLEVDKKFPAFYEGVKNEDLCRCLKETAPVRDPQLSPQQKAMVSEDGLRGTVSKVFQGAFQELQSNLTRFKNLNLSENLHKEAGNLCSTEKILGTIGSWQQSRGSSKCRARGEEFNLKLDEIFGTHEIAKISDQIKQEQLQVTSQTCISKQNYMYLRSSNPIAEHGYRFFMSGLGNDILDFTRSDFSDLISHDLFFNLAHRDLNFSAAITKEIRKDFNKDLREIYDSIYQNESLQKAAHAAIGEECESFQQNLHSFLCSERQPRLEARTLSPLIDNFLTTNPDFPTPQIVIDHHTNEYACNPAPTLSADDQTFNEFIKAEQTISHITSKKLSIRTESDFLKFNETFCNGREGKHISDDELPKMMAEFFTKKRPHGDLNAFFADPEIVKKLGISLDVSKNPMISIAPHLRESGELPRVSQLDWQTHIAPKLGAILNPEEISLLYGLIEMQTNARERQVKEVREAILKHAPGLSIMTPADVDAFIRGDKDQIQQISKKIPYDFYGVNFTVSLGMLGQAPQLLQQQQAARAERFGITAPEPQNTNQTDQIPGPPVVTTVTPGDSTSDEDSNTDRSPEAESPGQVTATKETRSPSNVSPVGSSVTEAPTGSTKNAGANATSRSSATSSTTNSASVTSSSPDVSTRPSKNSEADRIRNEIARLQREIADKQSEIKRNTDRISKNIRSSDGDTFPQRNSSVDPSSVQSFRESYTYPRSLPVKSFDGELYDPSVMGSELSSAGKDKASDSNGDVKKSGGGGGVSGQVSGGGGISGAGGGSSRGTAAGSGRMPARAESDEKLRTSLKLPVFEYPRLIPQSFIDMVGSLEKVVLLLGLEGKLFRTIEAIEEVDPETGKLRIRYFQRTYDFVPTNKFKNLQESFTTKEIRERDHRKHFGYNRSQENLERSRAYARATKEILKEEVEHSFVLQNQDKILTDDELRSKIDEAMLLLK